MSGAAMSAGTEDREVGGSSWLGWLPSAPFVRTQVEQRSSPSGEESLEEGSTSWLGWLLSRVPSQEERVEQREESFSDLDEAGVVQVQGRDKRGRRVVVVHGVRMQPNVRGGAGRLKQYLTSKLNPLAEGPEGFVIVYYHTGTSFAESPGLLWMLRTWHELPSCVTVALRELHVVHPGFAATAAAVLLAPLAGRNLWSKLRYVSRVEFLWDVIDKRDGELPPMPDEVNDHDEILEQQPLADYGVWVDPMMQRAGGAL
jgi:hypothetical protein